MHPARRKTATGRIRSRVQPKSREALKFSINFSAPVRLSPTTIHPLGCQVCVCVPSVHSAIHFADGRRACFTFNQPEPDRTATAGNRVLIVAPGRNDCIRFRPSEWLVCSQHDDVFGVASRQSGFGNLPELHAEQTRIARLFHFISG